MSQRTWSLVLLLLASMPSAAQVTRWPYYDPDVIEKLYKNDYQHVGNDNASRQDLMAVIAAFGLPDDPDKKCAFVTDDSLAGGAKLASYMIFLGTDFQTGEYPSREAREIAFVSALYPDPPYVYINDPNLRAMALEIETHTCKSERIQTIRRNFVTLLDDRMGGRNIPASAVAPRLPPGFPVPGQPSAIPGGDAAAQRQAAAAAAERAAAQRAESERVAAERAAAQRAEAERAAAQQAALQAQHRQLAQQQAAKAQECSQRIVADQAAGRPQQEIQQTYLACVQQVQQLAEQPGSAEAASAQRVRDQYAKAQECTQRLQADQAAGRPPQEIQQTYMACLQQMQQLAVPR